MHHGITCPTCGATDATVTVADVVASCGGCGATWTVSAAQAAEYRHAAAHERGYAGYRMAYDTLRPPDTTPAGPADDDDDG